MGVINGRIVASKCSTFHFIDDTTWLSVEVARADSVCQVQIGMRQAAMGHKAQQFMWVKWWVLLVINRLHDGRDQLDGVGFGFALYLKLCRGIDACTWTEGHHTDHTHRYGTLWPHCECCFDYASRCSLVLRQSTSSHSVHRQVSHQTSPKWTAARWCLAAQRVHSTLTRLISASSGHFNPYLMTLTPHQALSTMTMITPLDGLYR